MCEGIREDGAIIDPNDPYWNELQAAAQSTRHRPRARLEQNGVYGDLVHSAEFAARFAQWLGEIWLNGCESALKAYTAA